MGTTVLKTNSAVRFSNDTWLPFCLNSTKPARLSARTTRSPETLGSLGMSVGDFDGRPERGTVHGALFRHSPGFQIKLDRLAQVCASALDVRALRCDAQFRAPGHVQAVFFRNERGEAISHKAMLAEVWAAGKNRTGLVSAHYTA